MSLDQTSGMIAPDLHPHDGFAPQRPHGNRRLRVLDFCAGAFLAASALAVLANALLFQPGRTHTGTQAGGPLSGMGALVEAMTGEVGSGAGEAVRAEGTMPVAPKFTSISVPAATSTRTTAAPAEGNLGYLASKTPVTGMASAMVPVRPNETDVKGLTAPKRMSNVRPSADIGPPTASAGVIRPPQGLPASTRTRAVQRALAKLGYGPLKVDGVESTQTSQAIQRFQQDRKMPINGQINDRLLRELSAVSGMKLQ